MTTDVTPLHSPNEPWPIPVAPGSFHARVEVPGSKSETNRALLLAALADGPSTITGALDARDTALMRRALAQLGVGIEADGGRVQVHPPTTFRTPEDPIDCGLAGTVMRFVPPLAATADGQTQFTGDPEASQRPLSPILEGLRQLGAHVEGDAIPCTVTGSQHLGGREVTIDASGSSQFVSGLLLAGARFPNGLRLRHVSDEGRAVPSRPHVDMTVAMLHERGVSVREVEADLWEVEPGPVHALDQRIEPDLTSAAVFLAAAALTGGSTTVPGWPADTTQGGDRIRDVLTRMGAHVELVGDELTVSGSGGLAAIDVDLHDSSELTPVVAALALLASGTSVIRGVAHIRGHETDRLAALESELGRVGGTVRQTADGLEIVGVGPAGTGLVPALLRSYADHRMVHTAVLLGLVVPGCRVDDVACTTKTINDFDQLWTGMLGTTR
ncbi:3-phosphoshikimate 1-carboxyvinyltransferase [Luteococcus sp. Sow4_B9]|uniref:3-phosphoshikimate 1-carboxyvinyltransferase n=1 Tax=Luteococcus sp. Sow4_B9 TaxID=3438792 RepID=UPI003F9CD10C